MKVTCFIRKYCQYLQQNSKVHNYNTRRKMDIHVKLHKTEVYKKSVINMGTKVYNNLPRFIKEIGGYKAFKKESAEMHTMFGLGRDAIQYNTITHSSVKKLS